MRRKYDFFIFFLLLYLSFLLCQKWQYWKERRALGVKLGHFLKRHMGLWGNCTKRCLWAARMTKYKKFCAKFETNDSKESCYQIMWWLSQSADVVWQLQQGRMGNRGQVGSFKRNQEFNISFHLTDISHIEYLIKYSPAENGHRVFLLMHANDTLCKRKLMHLQRSQMPSDCNLLSSID